MPIWNGSPLPEASVIKIPDSLPQNFNWESYKADPSGTFNKFKGVREVHRQNWRGYKTAASSSKRIIASSPSRKFIADAGKQVRNLKKTTESASKTATEAKNLWDKFLSKVKGNGSLDKAAQAGGTVSKGANFFTKFAPLLAFIVAVGMSVIVNEIQGWRADMNEKGQQNLSNSISKVLGLMNVQKQRIDKTNIQVQKAELENQRVKDRIYSLEKQQPTIRESAADAKKKANDALYEVRSGRTKLESEITDAKKKANDALYETRTGRTKLESSIATTEKKANDALYETRTGRTKLDAEIAALKKPGGANPELNQRVQTIETRLAKVEISKPSVEQSVLKATQDSIKTIGNTVNDTTNKFAAAVSRLAKLEALPPEIAAIKTRVQTVETEHPKKWGITVTQAEVRVAEVIKSTDSATRTYVDRKLATVTQSQFSASEWVGRYGQKTADFLNGGVSNLNKNDEVLSNAVNTLGTNFNQRIEKLEKDGLIISDPAVGILLRKVGELQTDLKKTGTDLNENKNKLLETNKDLEKLKIQTKEQEKVNKEGNDKLGTILGILPLIPGRTANAIRPDIPTIPQIEAASATGTCRTLQPGGCGSKALDGLGNGVNQNTNNQANGLFDKLNAGANAVQLGLLKVIDNKLGNQITGGISGKLVNGFKWLQLDRALGVLTFAATIQNHVMLSRDIGTTLLGAFSNVLTLIGLKDDKGEAFDLGSIINYSIESLVKGIVGAENYATISEAWAKANRIYQATTNVLNSFQSLSSAILTGLEMTAGKVGKIGNALRKSGEVLESAYGWMNPQPKFNRISETLEKLQAGASTIQQVTQAPLDIINATTELTNATTELTKAIKEDDKDTNKGKESPEPAKLKADELKAKVASFGLDLDLFDFQEDE